MTLVTVLSGLGCGLFSSSMWVGLLCRGVGSIRASCRAMLWAVAVALSGGPLQSLQDPLHLRSLPASPSGCRYA